MNKSIFPYLFTTGLVFILLFLIFPKLAYARIAIEQKEVRPVLVIPKNQQMDSKFPPAIDEANRSVREWYQKQLNGRTFKLKPLKIYYSDKELQDYRCEKCPPIMHNIDANFLKDPDIWDRQPDTIHEIFIIGAGAVAGGGQHEDGLYGFTVLGDVNLELISNIYPNGSTGNYCHKILNNDQVCSKNGQIGAIAHELGHALTLDHGSKSEDEKFAHIMGVPYVNYPKVEILNRHLDKLSIDEQEQEESPEQIIEEVEETPTVEQIFVSSSQDFVSEDTMIIDNPAINESIVWNTGATDQTKTIYIKLIYYDGQSKDYLLDLNKGNSTVIEGIKIIAKIVKEATKLVVNGEEVNIDSSDIDLENIIKEIELTDEQIINGQYRIPIEVCFNNNEDDCLRTVYNFTLNQEAQPQDDFQQIEDVRPSEAYEGDKTTEEGQIYSNSSADTDLDLQISSKCGGGPGNIIINILEAGEEVEVTNCQEQGQTCQEFINDENKQDARCVDPQ